MALLKDELRAINEVKEAVEENRLVAVALVREALVEKRLVEVELVIEELTPLIVFPERLPVVVKFDTVVEARVDEPVTNRF